MSNRPRRRHDAAWDEPPHSVTLIIPQYDQPELTVTAIRTLRTTDPIRWPILIVDNGSHPRSLRALQDYEDEAIEVLSLPQPGLTAAWNRAAARASGEFLIFLNNDTCSTGPWVEPLLQPIRSGCALVTGVEGRYERQLTPPVRLLTGWCLALRKATFMECGGFDESLQLYFSDTDLLLRIQNRYPEIRPAWQVVPQLPITHLKHRTTQEISNRSSRWSADRARFLQRWREGN